jgi:hypothetical protein
MKFGVNQIWGIVFYVFGSLLYSLNQILGFLLFANQWSEIIFVWLMQAFIALGIAMALFDEFWTEVFVGFFSIFFTIIILNAALLLFDAFNTFRYASTDYFLLFKYAIDLREIPDLYGRLLIAIAPTLGVLLWWAISKDSVKVWWEIVLFALGLFSLTLICTFSANINIFLLS